MDFKRIETGELMQNECHGDCCVLREVAEDGDTFRGAKHQWRLGASE